MKQIKDCIAEYINNFEEPVKSRLLRIREIFIEEVPNYDEDIKYQMPTIIYNGNLIHYAGFKKHIGIYPLPNVLIMIKDETKQYKTGKGSIQFQNNEPLPEELIRKIVKLRKEEKEQEITKKK